MIRMMDFPIHLKDGLMSIILTPEERGMILL